MTCIIETTARDLNMKNKISSKYYVWLIISISSNGFKELDSSRYAPCNGEIRIYCKGTLLMSLVTKGELTKYGNTKQQINISAACRAPTWKMSHSDLELDLALDCNSSHCSMLEVGKPPDTEVPDVYK